ncbi:glycosyltransferase family 4 protein [Fervidibacillus halotolerans]|uniref:Glycosyltransferase family 4 protein n=1 Tax=Fervidibacillus halotolerans TaxID=2980027 RepID=A0A9E8RYE1_9BACI|nr:glycosyltransferase family 4 protein [Fervidibacillus halotolerans]WAA12119.1 glycosyltransferase family 4 protein [Fervidibacillus halotolerans]
MKKLVVLSNDHAYTYNFRKEIIQRLIEKKYKVYLVLPYGKKVEELKKMGCEFIHLELDRRGVNPLKDSRLFLGYFKILKKLRPNAVLAYTIKPNIYGGLACRMLNIPYINNITGLGSGFNKGKLLKRLLLFLYRISLKKSSCVFFQNKEDMKFLVDKKIVKNNYELIPGSGVNLEEFQYKEYPKKEPITFLFIGRIMKDKGIDQYLEAAKTIRKKYPNTRFNIIGFVEKTQPHYNKLIQEYQEKGYVNYLGYQEDVKPFIEEAHCVIQPSFNEGLSNVLLEGAAMGRPLIASDIPGCKEVIDINKNGFTFTVKNSNSLINQIEKFMKLHIDEKERMGKYSRKKVEKEFDRNFVIQAYLNQINKLDTHQEGENENEFI